MITRPNTSKRDRIFVEASQIDTYRELAGLGTRRQQKAKGADLPPFEDLKDVFLMASCLGLQIGHRTRLQDRKELARTSYFDQHTDLAVLRAIAVAETDRVEVLADENEVFKIAEEYANTGFAELKRRILGPGRPLPNLVGLLLEEYESLYPPGQSEKERADSTENLTEHH